MTNSLIPPATTSEEEEKATTEGMIEAEMRYQQEEDKYVLQQKIYVAQLSAEESNTSSDYSGYSYSVKEKEHFWNMNFKYDIIQL